MSFKNSVNDRGYLVTVLIILVILYVIIQLGKSIDADYKRETGIDLANPSPPPASRPVRP